MLKLAFFTPLLILLAGSPPQDSSENAETNGTWSEIPCQRRSPPQDSSENAETVGASVIKPAVRGLHPKIHQRMLKHSNSLSVVIRSTGSPPQDSSENAETGNVSRFSRAIVGSPPQDSSENAETPLCRHNHSRRKIRSPPQDSSENAETTFPGMM